jgi:hypothetical protein
MSRRPTYDVYRALGWPSRRPPATRRRSGVTVIGLVARLLCCSTPKRSLCPLARHTADHPCLPGVSCGAAPRRGISRPGRG